MIAAASAAADDDDDDNHFLYRPFPFLPDWFYELSDHLMCLFCSTAGFVCMVCLTKPALSRFSNALKIVAVLFYFLMMLMAMVQITWLPTVVPAFMTAHLVVIATTAGVSSAKDRVRRVSQPCTYNINDMSHDQSL